MAVSTKKSGKDTARRVPPVLLGLDCSTTAVKAVRLKKEKDQIALTAAAILPPCGPDATERPDIPKELSAYYAALCASVDSSMVRVFSQVLPEDGNVEPLVRENLGASADYRVGGRVIFQPKNKRENSTILGAAFPEKAVQQYLRLFSQGAPAVHSLEVPGLAAFSAFLYTCGAKTADQTVCLLEVGARGTYAAFLVRNQLQLISRFDFGSEVCGRQIEADLGVDAEMAGAILSEGAIDVTASVRQAFSPVARQISVFREFVERQSKSQLAGIYLSGGPAASGCLQNGMRSLLGIAPQVWNPLEKLAVENWPDELKGQEPRFAAAVGAALAGMEAV